jgi:hypothetical protein
LVEGIILPPEVVGPLSGLAEDLGIDLLAKLPHSVASG